VAVVVKRRYLLAALACLAWCNAAFAQPGTGYITVWIRCEGPGALADGVPAHPAGISAPNGSGNQGGFSQVYSEYGGNYGTVDYKATGITIDGQDKKLTVGWEDGSVMPFPPYMPETQFASYQIGENLIPSGWTCPVLFIHLFQDEASLPVVTVVAYDDVCDTSGNWSDHATAPGGGGGTDTDGDGIPDDVDPDDDNDGIPDEEEPDTDGDGEPDDTDTDDDGDGIPDDEEPDDDGDGIDNDHDPDDDNDGIPDDEETDTDGDGIPDDQDPDDDGDGIPDDEEPDTDGDGIPDDHDPDDDGDGIPDDDEPDTDGDGEPDDTDTDDDNDGLPDDEDTDDDNDGIPDDEETDTDGDGIDDEHDGDDDGDGIPDNEEPDTDGDGVPDDTDTDDDNDGVPDDEDPDDDGDGDADDGSDDCEPDENGDIAIEGCAPIPEDTPDHEVIEDDGIDDPAADDGPGTEDTGGGNWGPPGFDTGGMADGISEAIGQDGFDTISTDDTLEWSIDLPFHGETITLAFSPYIDDTTDHGAELDALRIALRSFMAFCLLFAFKSKILRDLTRY
jgi:hypothetical protein